MSHDVTAVDDGKQQRTVQRTSSDSQVAVSLPCGSERVRPSMRSNSPPIAVRAPAVSVQPGCIE